MLNKIKYRIKILSTLKPFAIGVKKFYLLSLLLSIAGLALSFIQPLFYKVFVDDVILKQGAVLLLPVVAGYLSVFVFQTLIGYGKYYANNRLSNRVTFKVKFHIWSRLFREDFPTYETWNIGDKKMRLDEDVTCIAAFLDVQTIGYLINYAMLLLSLVFMFLISWQLTVFSMAVIPVTFFLDHVISKKEWEMNEKNRVNDQKQATWLHDSIQGWREVKALNLQRHEERRLIRFTHLFSRYFIRSYNYKVTRIFVLPKIKDEFFMQFSLYFIGGLLIIGGHFTIGALLMFAQYYGLLSSAVKAVSSTDANLQSGRAASDRLISEIERGGSSKEKRSAPPADLSPIEFSGVTFGYPQGERYIFEGLNLRIEKGERVALIGRSGCGKTTLLKLLTGMLQPVKGEILFSGMRICDMDLSKLHKRMGLVMQENMLFHTTIRENLLYGKMNATDSELDEACQKACIYEFISSLPEKYETVIGEKGINLSGGQRQRIVLARLFLRKVDIFIFDEATSALDQYSENVIQDGVKSIGRDKTIIVVAHRKSSICNRIVNLDSLVNESHMEHE